MFASYFGCSGSLPALRGLARCSEQGHSLLVTCRLLDALAFLSLGARAPGRTGFSSRYGARQLWFWRRSCASGALGLLHGMRDSPEPGTEPTSPALADRFLSPAPPGCPNCSVLKRPAHDILVIATWELTEDFSTIARQRNKIKTTTRFHYTSH